MRKNYKLPREGVAERRDNGLNLDPTDSDTEAHGQGPDGLRLPGTGGDVMLRRPSSGGELTDEQDVEGHGITSTHGPGTGGDSLRRPSSGGE